MKRLYRMSFGIILVLLCPRAIAYDVFDPGNATIGELRVALDAGRVSSAQLVRYYLARIRRFNNHGPHINALITVNKGALARARWLDAHATTGNPKSLLYGIPFVAKDNFNTLGLATSGGSAALKHSVPATNAFVLQKLLDEGAVLIGKANMSELAASYGRFGYSSAGGLTLNPFNTTRDASGSSSGSAAAVAADFAAFALGTDTSGSLRGPANVTGLVGLRPTLGLTSRNGVIPLSPTFDTTGVLTRTVKDAAIVLDVIAGIDDRDAATLQQPSGRRRYVDALDAHALSGVRLGVIANFRGANSEVDGIEDGAMNALSAQGAVLVPITLPKDFEDLWRLILAPVGEAEFKASFERYLLTLPESQPRSLAQVIEISASPAVVHSITPVNPKRLQALKDAQATLLNESPAYVRIVTELIPSVRRRLMEVMEKNALRAFVFSTMSCPATPRFDRLDPSYLCRTNDPYKAGYVASVAGFPEITVPAGRISSNMPVGLSFMGLPYSEAQLLALAVSFEATVPHLPAPKLY